PHTCQPCAHVFCEPCLRRLAKNRATNTPCPLCRCLISHTSFHRGPGPNGTRPQLWRYRPPLARPDGKDSVPEGLGHLQAELPERSVCSMASAQLPRTLTLLLG
ncbi:hypothetical protein GOODEAATRI_022403, partial [Goodea atripinnis]